jgi:Ran GTPase-activating protein (RanGAP) involved in mRNA processing and transport
MLKYKSQQAIDPNQWIKLLKSVTVDQISEIVTKFVEQLQYDYELLHDNKEVSDCALNTPRMYGFYDKQYNIGHKIAMTLFPIDETNTKNSLDIKKKWSYIKYQRLLSKLSAAFREQIEKEETLKAQYKEVRKTYQRKYFCELKNRPVNKLITDPVPMPVEVSKIEELQPFFDHLSNNTPLINIPQLEFKRGVQYEDGRMDLCKQVVGPPHIGKLMDSLKNNTHINHFLLGNNIIGLNGANAIHNFLLEEHKPQIKTWYLAGNEIDGQSTILLADALKNDTVCEALWLKRNPLKALGGKYIGELMEINKKIKILDLHNTGLLDEGTKYIFQSLKKNDTLRQLYLDADGITIEGARYIAEYFDFLVGNNIKGVTSLWIDMNRIDDDGMILIANSLKNYKYLKRLFVGSNRLSDISVKVLCDNLVDHPNLIVFDLGLYKSTSDLGELPNNFGDKGAEYIAEFMKQNKSLKVLSVLHNDLTINGINKLNEALQESNLIWLYYEQYGLYIPQETRQMLNKKMEENIMKNYNMSVGDFCNNELRYIRGSHKLKNIDSVYRNRM